jgi:hypothetical protein
MLDGPEVFDLPVQGFVLMVAQVHPLVEAQMEIDLPLGFVAVLLFPEMVLDQPLIQLEYYLLGLVWVAMMLPHLLCLGWALDPILVDLVGFCAERQTRTLLAMLTEALRYLALVGFERWNRF